jgi:hypothetical protein
VEEIIKVAQTLGVAVAEIILMIYFCKQYLNNAIGKINVPQTVIKQNAIDMEMIKKMDFVKELVAADRILLFEFHNGQHYSNYRSALKMSASYEVYRAGLESSREKCSNLPISIMPKFISTLTQEGKVVCRDIETIKNDMGNSYAFKKSIGIKSFYDVAIRDINGNIIGFVAVQWNDEMPCSGVDDEVQRLAWYLEDCVRRLTCLDHQEKNKVNLFPKIFKKR